ncbi:hypothetical protein FRB94_002199 [Tulasnella sp. JGI-2019a]|nr:hypothetical protein FRB94_002199 [Tulasnella sp. JGI-2019a]
MAHTGWINDLQPRSSNTPQSCTPTCPSTNNLNRGVFMTYPIGSSICICGYSVTSIIPYADYNFGHQVAACPASIPITCNSRRSLATKRDRIAAKPQPATVPVNMRSLASLKKSKLAARALKASEMASSTEEEN